VIELQGPSWGVDVVLARCEPSAEVQAVKDVALELSAAESDYATRALANGLAGFNPLRGGLDEARAEHVPWVYKNRLGRKSSSARGVYRALRNLAPGEVCPICMARDVAALDHFLPKKHFPALAVQPSNLVPICSACNTIKTEQVMATNEQQFLHPYFDRLGPDWLSAEVEEEPTSPLVFSIKPSSSWSDELAQRVQTHFRRFDLANLYRRKSAHLLSEHRLGLETLFTEQEEPVRAGSIASETLRWSASHAEVSPWKAAAFAAWSRSDWFCHGGWRVAPNEDNR